MQQSPLVLGNTVSIASGKPFSPSQQAIKISLTPRFLSSFITETQNLAPERGNSEASLRPSARRELCSSDSWQSKDPCGTIIVPHLFDLQY